MTANEGTKREKRGRQLSMPTVIRLSEWGMRFLLAAVLAGGAWVGGAAAVGPSCVAGWWRGGGGGLVVVSVGSVGG